MARRGPFLPVDIAEAAIADTKPKPFALPDYYTPDVPDAAPNVEGWTPQQMGSPASSMDEYQQGLADLERARRGESLGTAPELTDPLARRYLAPGLEGRFSLLDVGGVGRGTVLSLLQGQNPAERSLTEDVTAIRGIDVPVVRSLTDHGLSFNLPEQLPVVGGANINLTPKTVGGFVVENIADPTTYVGIGGANAIKGELDDAAIAAGVKARQAARRSARLMGAADNALAEASGATEAAVRRQVPEAFQAGRVPGTDELFTLGPNGERVGPTGGVSEMLLGREPGVGENVNARRYFTNFGRAQQAALAADEQAAFRSASERAIAGADEVAGIAGGAGDIPGVPRPPRPGASRAADDTVKDAIGRTQKSLEDWAASVIYVEDNVAINGVLRGRRPQDVERFAPVIARLDNATTSRRLPENVRRVYRGVGLAPDDYAALRPGAVLDEPTYLSTSTEQEVADYFARSYSNQYTTPVRFDLDIPDEAAYGVSIPEIGRRGVAVTEGEVLLPRGLRVRVDAVDANGPITVVRGRIEMPQVRGIGGGADLTPADFARLAAKKAAGEALTPDEQDSVLQALGKAMGASTADEQAIAREALYNGPVPTDMREVDTGLIEGVRGRLGAPTGRSVEDALKAARSSVDEPTVTVYRGVAKSDMRPIEPGAPVTLTREAADSFARNRWGDANAKIIEAQVPVSSLQPHPETGLVAPQRIYQPVDDALSRARQGDVPAEPQGDVLAARIPNPLPSPVRARNRSAQEAGQRVGNLLRPRGLEQLGPDATVSDVIGVAQDTRRMVESQQIALSSRAKTYVEALGPTVKDGAGNYRLRNVIKADGAPALLQDVLENPARYPLTPEQAKAVADYQALVQAVRDEPRTFGVKVRTTGLEDGQSYIPRQAAADTSGAALEARGGGAAGARLRSMREKGRVFRDPEQAARAGVVYEHPLTAFQSYVRQNLEGAANQHIASMLKTFGETAADRVDPSLRGQWQSLRERISARRKTLAGQQARAASVNRAADEAIRESERANRLAVSAEVRAMLKKAKIEEFDVSTPDEIVQSFPSMESLRTEADALRAQLARRTGARGVARRLGEKEALISLRSAAEQSGGDVDRMVEILSQYAEDSARFQTETASRYAGRGATAPAFGTAERAQWEADRAASGIRKNRGPQRMAVGVEAPFDGPEAAYRAYDEIVSHAIDNSIVWTSRQPGTQAGIKAADAELRVMIREARRADAAAERAGARSVAGESARARTWAEITNLQQERDALKHRWELAQERANQVPAGRARVDQNAAPALIGTDFAEKDARRISRYYANGILPQNAIGDVLRGAAKVNRAIIPMQAIGDASATLRQLGTVLPSHPITFAKNFGNAARDLFPGGQARYREWLASPEVQDAASRGLALVGEGGVPNDFHASWFSRVPVLKQAQQHFEMISNRNRVDIFNQDVDMLRRTGQRVDDAAMEQVARNANRITGVANNRATDAETLTEFAANWMRSRLETLTKAVADGGIEGQLARGYLKNYVATGLIAAGAAAMASGRDPREVLNPIQERNGRFSYNPNFGTVRVGGVDVDMFGSYSDLARLAVMAADAGYGALTERDLTELAKPLIYAARTKGAPWLSMGADVATGENIVGDPVNSWTYWLTKPIPINAAVAVRNEQEGKPFLPSVAEGVAQFFGARANQLTPTERVQQGEYGQMSPQQQFKAIPAQAWRIAVEQAPEQYKAVARYDSASAFYQALVDEYTQGWIERGASPLEAEAKARASAARHPVYRAFQNARNYYENQWTAQNPEQRQADAEAQLNLQPSERRNMPREQERRIIQEAMR